MKILKLSLSLLFCLIVTLSLSPTLTGCGGGGSSGGGTGGGDFSTMGAIISDDGLSAILVDSSGNSAILKSGSLTSLTGQDEGLTIYYGSNGLPTRTVYGNEIVVYDWDTDNSTVDIACIKSDGSSTLSRDIAVDSRLLTELLSYGPGASTNLSELLETKNLYDISSWWDNLTLSQTLNYGGRLLGAGLCVGAVYAAIQTGGLSEMTGAGVFTCGAVFATETIEYAEIEDGGLGEGTLFLVDSAQCIGQGFVGPDCASAVITVGENVAEAGENYLAENSDEVSDVEATLQGGGGVIQITLTWWSGVDLDLHVIDPNSEEIYYSNTTSTSGGYLDVDDRDGGSAESPAVENVRWTSSAPSGSYIVKVRYFSGSGATDYRVIVNLDESSYGTYDETISSPSTTDTVTTFTYSN
jgi:hypothetical protein